MSDEASVWRLRLLAAGIAAVIWLLVSYLPRLDERRVPRSQREVLASLSYAIPDGYMLVNTEQTVTVQISGPSETVRSLTSEEIDLEVPLPNPTPGAVEVPLTTSMFEVPEGIEVQSMSPSSLSLLIDRRSRKEVPITIRFRGEPAGGFLVDPLNCRTEPETTQIEGPETRLQSIAQVFTEEINLDGHGIAFVEPARVVVEEGDRRLIRITGTNLVQAYVNGPPEDGPPEPLSSSATGFLP